MSTTERSGGETLEQVLEQRNRLWAELQRLRSQERELEHWRSYALDLETSIWWQASEPLRIVWRAIVDAAAALSAIAHRLRERCER